MQVYLGSAERLDVGPDKVECIAGAGDRHVALHITSTVEYGIGGALGVDGKDAVGVDVQIQLHVLEHLVPDFAGERGHVAVLVRKGHFVENDTFVVEQDVLVLHAVAGA